jgi:1,4-dihydroxy-2-naphthoate octaprenyltransferase
MNRPALRSATATDREPPSIRTKPKFPWIRLIIHPAHSLPAAIAPVLIGAALAYHNRVFSLLPVVLSLLASWFIHVGGLFWENYWLLTRHAALREHPDLASAVDDGSLSLPTLRRVTAGWFALAVLAGGYLVTYAGVMAPVFGAIGTLASLSYCAGRYSQTRLGIADPVFFAMFGIVAVAGTYYAQAAQFFAQPIGWYFVKEALPWQVFLVGLPLGAIITNVMVVDDLSDIDVDKAKNWKTRPIAWGVAGARVQYVGLMVFAYALPLWFWLDLGFSAWVLLPLSTLPLAVFTTRLVLTTKPADVEPMSPMTAAIGLLYAVLLSTALVLS